MQNYPSNLIVRLRKEWNKKSKYNINPPPMLPNSKNLLQLLDVAYHASLLTEEGRDLRFRIAVVPRYTRDGVPFDGVLQKSDDQVQLVCTAGEAITFAIPRPLNTNEIRRLAPATDFTQTIICVELHKDQGKESWVIWGLVDTGSAWWDYLKENKCDEPIPPNVLTITSTESGNLTISREGKIIVSLVNGHISTPSYSPLYQGAFIEFFKPTIEQLRNDIAEELQNEDEFLYYDEDRHVTLQYIEFIRLILFYIQQKGHGGTIFFVPDKVSVNDTRLANRLNVKYHLSGYNVWHRLIYLAVSKRRYFHARYKKIGNNKLEDNKVEWQTLDDLRNIVDCHDQKVRDAARFIASLSGVDGAVIVTNKLRVHGFGAEVIVTSPLLHNILIAEDSSGTKGFYRSIEDYGTRHRSAFRFCSDYKDTVAFVMSQDGGVKAVKKIGPEVVMWRDVNFEGLGV
ncbi:MAG TPA: hypothetical protein VFF14_04945 [Candidatus Deferrimicrobium sp.]|nr:hypothetical protein [Candidatus Deferrimicrobium sp.]